MTMFTSLSQPKMKGKAAELRDLGEVVVELWRKHANLELEVNREILAVLQGSAHMDRILSENHEFVLPAEAAADLVATCHVTLSLWYEVFLQFKNSDMPVPLFGLTAKAHFILHACVMSMSSTASNLSGNGPLFLYMSRIDIPVLFFRNGSFSGTCSLYTQNPDLCEHILSHIEIIYQSLQKNGKAHAPGSGASLLFKKRKCGDRLEVYVLCRPHFIYKECKHIVSFVPFRLSSNQILFICRRFRPDICGATLEKTSCRKFARCVRVPLLGMRCGKLLRRHQRSIGELWT